MSAWQALGLVPGARQRWLRLPLLGALLTGALVMAGGCRANAALTFDYTELQSVAQFVGRHAQAMRDDGAKMIEVGRAHNDAHVIADGQHQISDAAGMVALQDRLNTLAAELQRNPLTGAQISLERALANGHSLQGEGDALKAHAEAMVAHGNLMRDLSHQPGNEYMLEGSEAMLRDSLQMAQLATRLQDVGAGMVRFANDIKRSIGQ